MNFHALAKAPSPTQALKIETYRGQIKPAFFLQQPPDKRMTRIGVGGPQNQSIFEEVSNFKMKFYRAAPFLGPFSGTKTWTAAGDVHDAICRANAASFREIGPASSDIFQHGSRTEVGENPLPFYLIHFCFGSFWLKVFFSI